MCALASVPCFRLVKRLANFNGNLQASKCVPLFSSSGLIHYLRVTERIWLNLQFCPSGRLKCKSWSVSNNCVNSHSNSMKRIFSKIHANQKFRNFCTASPWHLVHGVQPHFTESQVGVGKDLKRSLGWTPLPKQVP